MLKPSRLILPAVLAIVTLKLLSTPTAYNGEEKKNHIFSSPLHFRTLLAGNFGETRPNHFHGGIDIKTQGKEGKAVFAIGDGYICAIITNHPTLGNALVVKHPQGYLSMYYHLQRFAPNIAAYAKKNANGPSSFIHQRGEVYRKNFNLSSFQSFNFHYPVAKGQLIAMSGSTGVSMGPHLHLELKDTRTSQLLDPLDYIDLDITDQKAPELHELRAYPQDTLSHFCGHRQPYNVEAPPADPSSLIPHPSSAKGKVPTAWGRVAFAINAHDYMDGSANKLGIRLIQFYVDKQLVFQRTMQRFMPSEHQLAEKTAEREDNNCYLYTWQPKGVSSNIYATDDTRGIVNFDHERDYHLVFLLTDQQGNQNRYAFTVRGRKETAPETDDEDELDDNHDTSKAKLHEKDNTDVRRKHNANVRKKGKASIKKKGKASRNRKHRRC